MLPAVCSETIELLLSSVYKHRGDDGLEARFLFGEPGAPEWPRRIAAEIFFRQRVLTRSALHVRGNGPAHFRFMSVADIRNLLTKFIIENYGYIFNDLRFEPFDCSYAEQLSPETKATLSWALEASPIFNPADELALYPLVTINLEQDFDSDPFFLNSACGLNQ